MTPQADTRTLPLPDLPPIDLAFRKTEHELLEVQQRLVQLRRAGIDDPWREESLEAEVQDLVQLRGHLFERLGRLAFSWLLAEGRIELRPGAEPQTIERVTVAREAPAPTIASAAHEEPSEPVVLDYTALKGSMGPGWASARQSAPREEAPANPEDLRTLLAELQPPEVALSGAELLQHELGTLIRVSDPLKLTAWISFPKELQRALVGHVVARARRLQDECPTGELDPAQLTILDRVFSSMTAWSKREQPGFVFGLQRTHRPVHGSWAADADHWWHEALSVVPNPEILNPEKTLEELRRRIEEGGSVEQIEEQAATCLDAGVAPEDQRLVALLMDQEAALQKKARFKRLRKAIRDARAEDEASDADLASGDAIAADWAFWPMVRGKRAAVVGGDLREDARRRIQETFGFQLLDWVTTDHFRNIQSLAAAVQGGGIDFVIVLRRFIGHDVDRVVLPACRTSGATWVSVDRGYGVNQIKLAIERFLGSEE